MSPELEQRLRNYFSRPGDLTQALENWWEDFQHRSAELEFADKPMARKLYQAASLGLQRTAPNPELLAAAVHYLCDWDDEESDDTVLGLEDDAEIWNLTCQEFDWKDLMVS